MWPLARYSFLEPIRNPWMVIGLLAISGLLTVMLVMVALEGSVLSGDDISEITEFLKWTRGFLFPIALILGFGLISQEVASGSIQLGLLRPIPRWRYLLARLAGRGALMAVLVGFSMGTIEVVAAFKGARLSPDRWIQWLGLLLDMESVILGLGVLGTVCTRFGSFVLYWLIYIMFSLISYFSSIVPHAVIWRTVNRGGMILGNLFTGPPLAWTIEAPLSTWHTARLVGGWVAHAALMFALGVWAFQYREPGMRE